MENEKIQIGIYKIDVENEFFKDSDFEERISSLAKANNFTLQEINQEYIIDEFRLLLFYKEKTSNPKWKDFLNNIVQKDQDILRLEISKTESFILFLIKKEEKTIYSISGGQGFFAIQEYIDENFGIDIIARLINKEDKILKAVKERNYVGSLIGTNKFFRKTYNLFENDSFGKIYEELNATLNQQILQNTFGFSIDDVKKEAICIAKSSFKINKAINLTQLIKIINGCEYVYKNIDPISINDVDKIIKNKNKELICSLISKLYHLLWQNYNKEENYYLFDLCHKEFEKYLTASKYIIKKGPSEKVYLKDFEFEKMDNVDILFDKLRKISAHPKNEEEFTKLLGKLRICSYNEDGILSTQGSFISHIFGDFEYDNKRYFYLEQSWYLIKDEFIQNLNRNCKNYINNNLNMDLNKKWNHPIHSENEYNQQYFGEENTLVLDKITPENIEICDVLKWDEQNLYLFHVKAGFGNTMRDLCSQVSISANRIHQAIRSSKKYLIKAYEEIKNKKGNDNYFKSVAKQTQQINKQSFLDLFDKKLVFVLGILDTSNKNRDIRDIEKFGSNIAKFSLQELIKEMKGIDIDLKIAQIKMK